MARMDRAISSVVALAAIVIGLRAAVILYVLSNMLNVFLPIPRAPSGELICPPQTIFDPVETQIIILLICFVALAASRVLWRRVGQQNA